MKRFKIALRIVFAVVMLLSVMILGTSATFKDQSKIQHTEAVNKLSELHIMIGDRNRFFSPSAHITRAEFCKIICIALNGGNDPTLD